MNEAELLDNIIATLNKNGWNSSLVYSYQEEYVILSDNKKWIVDIVLFNCGEPIGVIEVKQGCINSKNALVQAKDYAAALNVNLILITNGEEIYQAFRDSETSKKIEQFPTTDNVSKLFKLL